MTVNCRLIKHALSGRLGGKRPCAVCRKLVLSNQLMGVPGCSRTLGYRGATGIALTLIDSFLLPQLNKLQRTLFLPTHFLTREIFEIMNMVQPLIYVKIMIFFRYRSKAGKIFPLYDEVQKCSLCSNSPSSRKILYSR